MGDYVRWAPPFHEGVEDSAKSGMYIALNRGKRSIRLEPEGGGRAARRCCGSPATTTCCSSRFRPGVLDRLGVGYDVLRAGEPRPRLLRDLGLRPGRAEPRPLRPRHELPRAERPARPDRRGRRPAGPVRGPDRRPRRRRADGRVRGHGRAPRAPQLRRGPVRRRLDDRRRRCRGSAMVAGRYFADGSVTEARRQRARRLDHLLPPLRGKRRLGHARRPGAEVLAGLVQGGRPRGPDRASVRPARAPTPTGRSRRSSPRAPARSGASSPPSTTAASSRSSTSTRRSTPS